MVNQVDSLQVGTEAYDYFSQLYQEYYPKIYNYTIYRVGDPNIAEDLVSEVFEKVLLNYYTYNSQKAKFSTWLFAIANNTIINYYQKSKRQRQVSFTYLQGSESKYHLEDMVIEQEAKEILLKAIMCLEERQINIIALKFAAGQTNREIATMLDLSESNVGTILYRALKHLRTLLNEVGTI
ncbi:MAG: sigma-70 family RNA polymerase sigma factor [Syntrophomonadaceae bacterium]|nr:sigma-70 family RNA polymerase sigma factor [Syntrophomonadaceae bacterium]